MNIQKLIFTAGFILSSLFLLLMIVFSFKTEIPLEMLANRAIYRVFHIHLASAMTSYFMIVLSMVAGIVLLKHKSTLSKGEGKNSICHSEHGEESKIIGNTGFFTSHRSVQNDNVSFVSGLHFAAFELSFFFISFVLFSGMLWAKNSWGVYWNWEPRLTAAGVFWFLLLALMLLRNAMNPEFRDKVSAIFTIIVCCNIPFIHFASSWFGSRLHPASGTTEITGYAEVRLITWLTVAAVVIFSTFLVILRAKMHQQKEKINAN